MSSLAKTRALGDLLSAVEAWRKSKSHNSSPMPGELWESAVSLATKLGVTEVASRAKLEHSKLKRLVAERVGLESLESETTFLEIQPPQEVLDSSLVCQIEVESESGQARMRAQLTGASALQLVTIFREFSR